MRLACTSSMVPGKSLTEQAHYLRKWGFDGIAVFVNYSEWNEALYEELMRMEEVTGVVPCEFAFGDDIYGHLMDEDMDIRKKAREMYLLAATVCGKIGAVTELEFAYGPQNPLPLFHPYARMDSKQENEFLEMYRNMAEPLIGTKGMMLLEGINRYESPYLNSIIDCKDVVDKLNMDNTGVIADFFHMSIEESDMVKSIKYAGPSIKHVHLGDNNRLLPGYGTINWKKCFNALKEIEYKGFINLECSTCGDAADTLPAAAEFLKSLIR